MATAGRGVNELWAKWVARGLDESLFWELTPPEVRAVFDAWNELEGDRIYHQYLANAVTAATLANIYRKKGKPRVKPTDIVRRPSETRELTGTDLKAFASQYKSKKVH